MKHAAFAFTCKCDYQMVYDKFNSMGVSVSGDLKPLLNMYLKDVAEIFLPVPVKLFSRVELHVSDAGEPQLQFFTYPFKYTVFNGEYIIMTPGVINKTPVFIPVPINHKKYTVEAIELG